VQQDQGIKLLERIFQFGYGVGGGGAETGDAPRERVDQKNLEERVVG